MSFKAGSCVPRPDFGEDEPVVDGSPPPPVGVSPLQASFLICICTIKQHAGDGATGAYCGHDLSACKVKMTKNEMNISMAEDSTACLCQPILLPCHILCSTSVAQMERCGA